MKTKRMSLEELTKQIPELSKNEQEQFVGGFSSLPSSGEMMSDIDNDSCSSNGICKHNGTCSDNGTCRRNGNCSGNATCIRNGESGSDESVE